MKLRHCPIKGNRLSNATASQVVCGFQCMQDRRSGNAGLTVRRPNSRIETGLDALRPAFRLIERAIFPPLIDFVSPCRAVCKPLLTVGGVAQVVRATVS